MKMISGKWAKKGFFDRVSSSQNGLSTAMAHQMVGLG